METKKLRELQAGLVSKTDILESIVYIDRAFK